MKKNIYYGLFFMLLIIGISIMIVTNIEIFIISKANSASKQELDLLLVILVPIVMFLISILITIYGNKLMSEFVKKHYILNKNILKNYIKPKHKNIRDQFVYTFIILLGIIVMLYNNLDFADNRLVSTGNRYVTYNKYGYMIGILNYNKLFIGLNIFILGQIAFKFYYGPLVWLHRENKKQNNCLTTK